MMSEPIWPTREADLQIAQKIIRKHIDFNDGEPLGLFEIRQYEDHDSDYLISDWVLEILEHFSQQYGQEKGSEITQRVVSQCLLEGETIH